MNEELIHSMERIRNRAKVIDLSYTLEPGMPVWPTHARYGAIVYESYEEGAVSMHRQVSFGEHSGTHLDAPKHFFKDGKGIDEVDIKQIMGRGVKIDASNLSSGEGYSLEMLKEFEAQKGEIKAGDIVMFRFGWEDKYGLGKSGDEFLRDWPGVLDDAAQYLLEKEVSAVGTDALALDPYGVEVYPCHDILLGNNIPIIENLTNLKKIPTFTYVIGLANKIKGGSASPIRIAAFTEGGLP